MTSKVRGREHEAIKLPRHTCYDFFWWPQPFESFAATRSSQNIRGVSHTMSEYATGVTPVLTFDAVWMLCTIQFTTAAFKLPLWSRILKDIAALAQGYVSRLWWRGWFQTLSALWAAVSGYVVWQHHSMLRSRASSWSKSLSCNIYTQRHGN